MPKQCCGTSVGVLILNQDADRLMITRATAPAGIAPVAAHALGEHASYEDAARAAVHERVGASLVLERMAVGGHHPGRCRRIPHTGGGHAWEIYAARVPEDLDPVAAGAWYTRGQVQDLAERTVCYARGAIAESTWHTEPGLEPVWCDWLSQMGITRLRAADLDRIRRLAATPPAEYWLA